MLISNEHIGTYYFRSSRTGNHTTLGSREKLPLAIGATRPNHKDGSRWNLQPRHSLPSGDFPSYGSTLAAAFFVLPVRRVGNSILKVIKDTGYNGFLIREAFPILSSYECGNEGR